MKCALIGIFTGVTAFVLCSLVAFELTSAYINRDNMTGAYYPKHLPIRVRVVDTEERKPIADARVTFLRGFQLRFEDAEHHLADVDERGAEMITDGNGFAEVEGEFQASASKFTGGNRKYHLSDGWLKVVVRGRATTFVALDGHGFGAERDYEDDRPMEGLVVMNKVAAL